MDKNERNVCQDLSAAVAKEVTELAGLQEYVNSVELDNRPVPVDILTFIREELSKMEQRLKRANRTFTTHLNI